MSNPTPAALAALDINPLLNAYEQAVENEVRQDRQDAGHEAIRRASDKVNATRAKVVEAFAALRQGTEDTEDIELVCGAAAVYAKYTEQDEDRAAEIRAAISRVLAAARQGEEMQTRRPSDAGKAAALYAAEYHRLKRRYREACEAIAWKHNNPECACMFCDDLRAARAASQPQEVSRG